MHLFRARRGRTLSTHASAVLIALILPGFTFMQPAAAAPVSTVCSASTFSAGFGDSGAVVNGNLFMWGGNYDGELGLGYRLDVVGTPTHVATSTGLANVTGVWAGFQTAFATDASGKVWGWGDYNAFGERGNNTGFNIPGLVPGPVNVVSIGPAETQTIAVTKDGTLWGWGRPRNLGLPGSFPVNPTVLPGPANVVKVAAGEPYSLALTSNGTLYGTGGNYRGQLGIGSGVTGVSSFTAIGSLSGIVDIAASGSLGTQFTLAVDGSGNVYAFGSNFYGQMGKPASTTPQFTPGLVPGVGSVTQVVAGDGHALALKSDGTVWGWGANLAGQLGNGTTANSSTPGPVSFPAGVKLVRIAAGGSHSMALDSNGHLWGWGYNGDGEIGNGFILAPPVLTPVQLNLGPVASGCAPPSPKQYMPSVNGYQFPNDGKGIMSPSYERMADFYPLSRPEMYIPFTSMETPQGALFYNWLFLPFYVGYPRIGGGGLCFGMAASNQFLFNEFPDKSAYDSFPTLTTKFSDKWGPSPSPGDTTIEEMIDRYHSRQLAAAGALAAINSWNHTEDNGGNMAAMNAIAAVTDTGKTEWVGLGPARSLQGQGGAGWGRFLYLFNESHSVLAYGVNKSLMQIKVYDPNDPNDNDAYIQIVPDVSTPGGGMVLVHRDGVSYGGGKVGGTDYGLPTEWTLMPLPEEAFSPGGNVAGQDNLHWVLDVSPISWLQGSRTASLNGTPVFRMLGATPGSTTAIEMLHPGTGFAGTVTADAVDSQTSQMAGSHGAQIIQTDASAAGTTHQIAISPDATQVTLSNASAAEQYTLALDGDFLAASYGRRITLSGAGLSPGSTLDVSVDPSYSSLALSASGMRDERANLLLEQVSQTGGSASVTAVIPGNGAQGNVYVGDWTALPSSLIFEVVTAQDGRVTGLMLQDNPSERQALLTSLLQKVGTGVAQIADDGVRSSLQSKLDNATRQAQHNPIAAANMLDAMRNEIAAQSGKAIDPGSAASLDATLRETVGLLRATMG